MQQLQRLLLRIDPLLGYKFSNGSSLLNSPKTSTIELTFENLYQLLANSTNTATSAVPTPATATATATAAATAPPTAATAPIVASPVISPLQQPVILPQPQQETIIGSSAPTAAPPGRNPQKSARY